PRSRRSGLGRSGVPGAAARLLAGATGARLEPAQNGGASAAGAPRWAAGARQRRDTSAVDLRIRREEHEGAGLSGPARETSADADVQRSPRPTRSAGPGAPVLRARSEPTRAPRSRAPGAKPAGRDHGRDRDPRRALPRASGGVGPAARH